jgi:hypothetical protein
LDIGSGGTRKINSNRPLKIRVLLTCALRTYVKISKVEILA